MNIQSLIPNPQIPTRLRSHHHRRFRSGGGAGIQGDIKMVTALGGYAATAITALTAQIRWAYSAFMKFPMISSRSK